jgi:adenylate kinase family enzyme
LVKEIGRVRRVAVVGPGGAGKSTFARELGARTGLPVIHLDHHFWRPGWIETPGVNWEALQHDLFAADRWIADGNYEKTFEVRFRRADTVIVIRPGRVVCLAGALRRTIRHRGVAVQAIGCPERLDMKFLLWIWRYPRISRPRLDAALRRFQGQINVVELRSRRDMKAFLETSGRGTTKAPDTDHHTVISESKSQ